MLGFQGVVWRWFNSENGQKARRTVIDLLKGFDSSSKENSALDANDSGKDFTLEKIDSKDWNLVNEKFQD